MSNGRRGGLREGLGKHFLSEVMDPGRQEGRKLSEAERDAGNETFQKAPELPADGGDTEEVPAMPSCHTGGPVIFFPMAIGGTAA